MKHKSNSIKYIYPKLPSKVTTAFFRIAGNGLANCLYTYAKAVSIAKRDGLKIIAPTWFNLSIGPYLRHQSDKRHYFGLFNHLNEISGLNKWLKLTFYKKQIQQVEGLGGYFRDFIDDADIVALYIEEHVHPKLLEVVNGYDFTNCVAVHIRLGDYSERVRIPIKWYKEKIEYLHNSHPEWKFLIFSDGRDEELAEITSMESVKRVFFGNAIADIFAISRCCYMIGSDSTFSGWGAFLGQVPCIFYRKHYGPVLKDQSKEIVETDEILW